MGTARAEKQMGDKYFEAYEICALLCHDWYECHPGMGIGQFMSILDFNMRFICFKD